LAYKNGWFYEFGYSAPYCDHKTYFRTGLCGFCNRALAMRDRRPAAFQNADLNRYNALF